MLAVKNVLSELKFVSGYAGKALKGGNGYKLIEQLLILLTPIVCVRCTI